MSLYINLVIYVVDHLLYIYLSTLCYNLLEKNSCSVAVVKNEIWNTGRSAVGFLLFSGFVSNLNQLVDSSVSGICEQCDKTLKINVNSWLKFKETHVKSLRVVSLIKHCVLRRIQGCAKKGSVPLDYYVKYKDIMVEENDHVYGRSPNKNILLKIVILGDGGVGKSCLMSRFISNHFDDHNFHTIGVEFMNKTIEISGAPYTLQIWDTAGQERFKSLRTPFYRGTDICILAYAIDDRSSFNNIKMWLNEFLHYAGVKNGIEKFPFIVVGNKSDVSSKDREVSHEQLKQWCDENKIATYIETSAKTDSNVVEAFSLAVQRWADLEQKAEKELRLLHHPDTVKLHGSSPVSSFRATCCSRFSEG